MRWTGTALQGPLKTKSASNFIYLLAAEKQRLLWLWTGLSMLPLHGDFCPKQRLASDFNTSHKILGRGVNYLLLCFSITLKDTCRGESSLPRVSISGSQVTQTLVWQLPWLRRCASYVIPRHSLMTLLVQAPSEGGEQGVPGKLSVAGSWRRGGGGRQEEAAEAWNCGSCLLGWLVACGKGLVTNPLSGQRPGLGAESGLGAASPGPVAPPCSAGHALAWSRMLGLAWVPGPRLPPIPSVDKRLPGRRSLQRPLPRSQRTLQMCPRWISGERSPKKRLPGGGKCLKMRAFLSAPPIRVCVLEAEQMNFTVGVTSLALSLTFEAR